MYLSHPLNNLWNEMVVYQCESLTLMLSDNFVYKPEICLKTKQIGSREFILAIGSNVLIHLIGSVEDMKILCEMGKGRVNEFYVEKLYDNKDEEENDDGDYNTYSAPIFRYGSGCKYGSSSSNKTRRDKRDKSIKDIKDKKQNKDTKSKVKIVKYALTIANDKMRIKFLMSKFKCCKSDWPTCYFSPELIDKQFTFAGIAASLAFEHSLVDSDEWTSYMDQKSYSSDLELSPSSTASKTSPSVSKQNYNLIRTFQESIFNMFNIVNTEPYQESEIINSFGGDFSCYTYSINIEFLSPITPMTNVINRKIQASHWFDYWDEKEYKMLTGYSYPKFHLINSRNGIFMTDKRIVLKIFFKGEKGIKYHQYDCNKCKIMTINSFHKKIIDNIKCGNYKTIANLYHTPNNASLDSKVSGSLDTKVSNSLDTKVNNSLDTKVNNNLDSKVSNSLDTKVNNNVCAILSMVDRANTFTMLFSYVDEKDSCEIYYEKDLEGLWKIIPDSLKCDFARSIDYDNYFNKESNTIEEPTDLIRCLGDLTINKIFWQLNHDKHLLVMRRILMSDKSDGVLLCLYKDLRKIVHNYLLYWCLDDGVYVLCCV